MSEAAPLLEVRDLQVRYGAVQALKGISLAIQGGEIATLIGANGAGKSTLLRTLSGLVRPAAGSILFQGRSLAGASPESIVDAGICHAPEGRRIFADMSVRENLILGASQEPSRRRVAERLDRCAALFPVLAERSAQRAGTLSGGEQQMLAIGRALMAQPRLLMMDEPTVGLAPRVIRSIFETIAWLRSSGMTILLVEQNARTALRYADRGYVLETGRIVLEGAADELLENREVQRAYLGKGYKEVWE